MKVKFFISSISKLIIFFVAFWNIFILIFVTKYSNTVLNIFGGIQAKDNKILFDFISAFKWNIIVFIPVLICLVNFDNEFSKRSFYVLIRYKSILTWYFKQIIDVFIINYLYLTIGFIIISFVIIDSKLFILIAGIFPLYTISVLLCCLTVYLFFKDVKAPIFMYILINSTAFLDNINMNMNRLNYGCFGMLNRSDYIDKQFGFKYSTAVAIMAAIIFINIIIQAYYFKKNKLSTVVF